jgi:hypothetical protein
MSNDNPSCLKLDLDFKNQRRGDFFINGVENFSVDLTKSQKANKVLTFTISFTATASSSNAKDMVKGNEPIKTSGFKLDETEYEQLSNKEIIFFEIITDDPQSASSYTLDAKQVPKLEIAQDGTLTISLLLVNYWLGGEGKFDKNGVLPSGAANNAKKNPGITFPI